MKTNQMAESARLARTVGSLIFERTNQKTPLCNAGSLAGQTSSDGGSGHHIQLAKKQNLQITQD